MRTLLQCKKPFSLTINNSFASISSHHDRFINVQYWLTQLLIQSVHPVLYQNTHKLWSVWPLCVLPAMWQKQADSPGSLVVPYMLNQGSRTLSPQMPYTLDSMSLLISTSPVSKGAYPPHRDTNLLFNNIVEELYSLMLHHSLFMCNTEFIPSLPYASRS